MKIQKKEYDLNAINELFRQCITPEELREDLIELAFDYSQYVNDGNTDLFKLKMNTLYTLCNALQGVKVLEP